MKNLAVGLFCIACLCAFNSLTDPWLVEKCSRYDFWYTKEDQTYNKEYQSMLNTGIHDVETFFSKPFPKSFAVYVHPNRESWDEKLRKAYNTPDFKSECWMVASGEGFQLNMISPAKWEQYACEHRYSNKEETQKLITHELFHVFHGQHNVSPDFTISEGLDWFTEGFAAYGSGQLDERRKAEVKKMVQENTAPLVLDDFWKGKARYGISGSTVMFLDEKFGRDTLFKLLAFSKKSEVLEVLNVSEEDLVSQWRDFVLAKF